MNAPTVSVSRRQAECPQFGLVLEENPPLDPPDFLESFRPPGRAQFIGLQATHVLPDVVAGENGSVLWLRTHKECKRAVGIDICYDTYLRAPTLVLQILQTLGILIGALLLIGLALFAVNRLRQRRTT